eukprot:scaffold7349_cov133-Chaetoceros_neogracile.AAC.2
MPRLSDQLFRGRHERIPADDDHALSIPALLGNTEQIGHLDSSTNTGDVGNAGHNRNQSTIDLEANSDANSDADTNNSPDASDSNDAATATNQNLTLRWLIIFNTMLITFNPALSVGRTIAFICILEGLRRVLLLAERDINRRMSIMCAGVLLLFWIISIIELEGDIEDKIRDIPRMTLSFFLLEGVMVAYIRFMLWLRSLNAWGREQTRRDSRTTVVPVVSSSVSSSVSTILLKVMSDQDAKVRQLPLLPFGANNLQVADAVQAYELESSAQRDSLDVDKAGVSGGINHPTRFHQQQIAFSACESCSICITDFTMGEMVCLLPQCGHAYHSECVNKWLVDQKSAYCPLCQARVLI